MRAATAGRPALRVACIEWLDPIYVGGHWVPEMVETAGGMPCGFDVARTRQEIQLL